MHRTYNSLRGEPAVIEKLKEAGAKIELANPKQQGEKDIREILDTPGAIGQ